jgi:prepilin-type processing-associated H-X9-DG protein
MAVKIGKIPRIRSYAMKRAKKAFAVIDSLAATSAAAMILAVIVPVMSAARERARANVCATNLKNYGPALYMYSQDNSGRCPNQYWLYSQATLNKQGKGDPYRGCRWHYDGDVPDGGLWPYLKDKKICLCPTFRTYALGGSPDICPYGNYHPRNVSYIPTFSYSMNACLAGWRTPPMKVSEVKRASKCMVFSEENLWTIAAGQRIKENPALTYSNSVLNDNLLVIEQYWVSDNIATYHKVSVAKKNDGYANAVFADGHVSSLWGRAGSNAYLEYGKPYDGFSW